MKDIGKYLKESRLDIEITVQEVAEDLKKTEEEVEMIEEGNMSFFDDVNYVKDFIKEYAKYLGSDYKKLVDNYNEFLFDYTSKISLDLIKKAVTEEEKEIQSPYTISYGKKKNVVKVLVVFFILLVVFALFLFLKGGLK